MPEDRPSADCQVPSIQCRANHANISIEAEQDVVFSSQLIWPLYEKKGGDGETNTHVCALGIGGHRVDM
jgi:hypothetical protein